MEGGGAGRGGVRTCLGGEVEVADEVAVAARKISTHPDTLTSLLSVKSGSLLHWRPAST